VEGGAIYHKTEYRERRNHYTLFACTHPITGFDTSRDKFVGIHEGLHEARVPFAGTATNTKAFGWNPIGSHEVTLELEPGQSEKFAYILAYVDQGDKPKFASKGVINKEVGKAIIEKYSAPGAVDAAFKTMNDAWAGMS
jgi:cellobiose phosphorylase